MKGTLGTRLTCVTATDIVNVLKPGLPALVKSTLGTRLTCVTATDVVNVL